MMDLPRYAWEGIVGLLHRIGAMMGVGSPATSPRFGFKPLSAGWPPDGVTGDAARQAYQAAMLEPMAAAARAAFEADHKSDPMRWIRLAEEYGARYGIPPGWMGSIVHHESRGKPWVYNWGGDGRPSTAIGLGQTVYTSCRSVGAWHTFDPAGNLDAACRILVAHRRNAGSWEGALAGYAGVSPPYTGTLIARAGEFAAYRG